MIDHPVILLCSPTGRDVPDLCAAMQLRNPNKHIVQGDADSIEAELSQLVAQGATDITCLPLTLFADDLVKDVLPRAIEQLGRASPEVAIRLAREAGLDPWMLQAARDRVAPMLTDPPHQTVLVIVGDGATEEDANADLAKVSRIVWEGVGAAWSEMCFLDHATPDLGAALSKALAYGYPRVVVFSYTLNDKIDLSAALAVAREASQSAEILNAAALGSHDLVLDVLSERVRQAIEGDGHFAMNCQVCSFREQVLGEAHSHEHDDHAHSHGHDHGHSHS